MIRTSLLLLPFLTQISLRMRYSFVSMLFSLSFIFFPCSLDSFRAD